MDSILEKDSFNTLTYFKLEFIYGIWYSKGHSRISYPEEGNAMSFQLEDNPWWFKNRNTLIVNMVRKYSRGKLFWDIGGGNGFVSKGLQNAGQKVVLVEPVQAGFGSPPNLLLNNLLYLSNDESG
jgi:hypothetical protein